MRINKYLALRGYATRSGADALIARGSVRVNGRVATLGEKVLESDTVAVEGRKAHYRYYAFNKPRGVITHSPQRGEKDVRESALIQGVFPVGRLDKASHGLIILTDDARVTDRLLSPAYSHDKEYRVTTAQTLTPRFKERMEGGVNIEGYTTKRCRVRLAGDTTFFITLTEGKKHQIRRMCAALHVDIQDLERTRIMNIRLGNLAQGTHRAIEGEELSEFLANLKLSASASVSVATSAKRAPTRRIQRTRKK